VSFVHLHTHSHFSLLDGLGKIPELVARAKELGMPALALTDHGVLYGAVEFYQEATKAGIKPIIGVEAYVARNGYKDKQSGVDDRPYHITLLARNHTGYQNLVRLTTKAHLEGFYYKPRIDLDLLEKYGEGLIILTGCLNGQLSHLLLADKEERAHELMERYRSIVGPENVYIEIQHHIGVESQQEHTEKALRFADAHGYPAVLTNDLHYVTADDAEAHDALLAIQTKKLLTDTDRMSYMGSDFSLRPAEEMAALYPDRPELIENTLKIADACDIKMELGGYQLPYYPLPDGITPEHELRKLCEKNLLWRYPADQTKAQERLEYELSVIEKTGFASYFLIVQDFVNWAKNQDIVVGPGRGSAAGSIVAYLLNITNVDPIAYDLLFERFLNPERISMPDIDLDFADTRRDEVIRYVAEKYGHDRVAQIITFGTMAARASVRDVGRVMGLPYNYCDRVAKLIPMFTNLDDAIEGVAELKEIYENDEQGKKLLTLARRLEGVARHASTHACGVVITKDPLVEIVPTQHASASDQTIITQFSLHPIEDLGLLKMDFLGLSNLTILENTKNIVSKTRGITLDIDNLPLEDAKTFKLLQRGQTTGVFQLESSGMKRYLKELKPSSIEDIIAMVSLYRPGPMELLPDYIAGKLGKKKTTYLHPKLQPILEKTYGVAVYQEQVLQMARDLAGFSLGEADVLRKAVGKKIKSLLDEQRVKFVEGCVANGIEQWTAEKIFEFIEPFARYGFNRAHAACYGLIAYQTAYCKANYPAEFMAALLTSDEHNTDRVAIEIDECRSMHMEVLPPDVNESFASFTVVVQKEKQEDPNRIRFGLNAIKNLGTHVVEEIIRERKANGPFISLEDFLKRVRTKDLNKKSLESLVKSGALDSFGERKTLLENIVELVGFSKQQEQETENGQINLFGELPVTHAPQMRLREVAPATDQEKLAWEKDFLGLYLTSHPLRQYQDQLKDIAVSLAEIPEKRDRSMVIVGGMLMSTKSIITKKGDPMLFARLEDATGAMELVVFPRVYEEFHGLLTENALVLVKGRVSKRDGEVKILAEKVKSLAEHLESQAAPSDDAVRIVLTKSMLQGERGDALKALIKEYPGEKPIVFVLREGDKERAVPTKFSVTSSEEFMAALATLTKTTETVS
jgi:DNA polymerase-3 subunit alpha